MPTPGRTRRMGQAPLGEQGRRVRNQIIEGHTKEIRKLQAGLGNTTNKLQRALLAKQIQLEKKELARFRAKTQ